MDGDGVADVPDSAGAFGFVVLLDREHRRRGPSPVGFLGRAWCFSVRSPVMDTSLGATLRLPDDHEKRGWRSLLSRRALWLGLGPWFGFLVVAGIYLTLGGIDWVLVRILSDDRLAAWRQVTNWGPNRPGVDILVIGVVAYGWVVVALAAARRAFTRGRLWKSICRGLLTAGGFLGSLMGGFWAATSVFRAYFFDPRIAQVLLIAGVSVFLLGGCGPPPTVGEVHRRELFQAMMMAWVLGLALVWRWLARESPFEAECRLQDPRSSWQLPLAQCA